MNIELRPHVGKHCATGRPCDLQQDRIFVDGQHLGYVCRKPDAPINLIYPSVPDDVVQTIRTAVQAKYGGEAAKVAMPVELADYVSDTGDEADE